MLIKVLTTNAGKFAEIQDFFRSSPVQFEMEAIKLVEVQAEDLMEVVSRKLDSAPESLGNCLVDDSGLFIEALKGFPGVYSAYVYKSIGLNGICKLMEGLENRRARFECLLGLRLENKKYFFRGVCRGEIVSKPRGSGGFGFDPIFVPEGFNLTFAEMGIEEKNSISHRGRALRQLKEFLERLL